MQTAEDFLAGPSAEDFLGTPAKEDSARFSTVNVVTADDRLDLARRNYFDRQRVLAELGPLAEAAKAPAGEEYPAPKFEGHLPELSEEELGKLADEVGLVNRTGDQSFRTTAPAIRKAGAVPETEGGVVTGDSPMVPLGDWLLRAPRSETEAGVNESLAPTLNGLTSRKSLAYMLGSMGVAATGATAARLVSALWTGIMGKQAIENTPGIYRELGEEMGKPVEERDKRKIGKLLTDSGTQTLFTVLPAVHAGGEGPLANVAREFERDVKGADLGDVEAAAAAGGKPKVEVAEDFLGGSKRPDAEKPPAPTVPETPAEPERGMTVLGEIRQANARTIGEIQALFPKAELSREQARVFRDAAWEKASETAKEAETPPPSSQPGVEKTLPGANAEDFLAGKGPETAKVGETAKVEAGQEAAKAIVREPTEEEKAARVSSRSAAQNDPTARAEAERPWDLIDEVEGKVGGLSLASARKLDPDWRPKGAARKLFRDNGQGIDTASEAIRRSGVAKLPKDEDLLYALDAAADARKVWRRDFYKEEQGIEEQARGQERFEKDAAKFKRPHDAMVADDLMPGDKFELQGEKVEVQHLDFDEDGRVSHVTLKDGTKYGTVHVPGGTVIRMDEKSLQKAPREADWDPEANAPKVFSMSAGAGAPARSLPKAGQRPAPLPVPARPRAVPAPAAGTAAPPRATPSVWNHFTRARQAFQSVFSPQNIDPTAKRFSHILRQYNAQAALDLVRADEHLGELRRFFDRTPVPKDWVYDPAQALPHNFAVIDALERDRTRLPAALQDWGRAMDGEFAWRIAEVRKLKPGAMGTLIQNYFPHMWEDPKSGVVQSLMAEAAARAPLHGSKAFLEQRSLPLTVDGLARGLRPISDNPVDLALAKLHQMDKFIMAARTIEESKQNGMLKYYPLGKKIPAGRRVVDDPAFTVYAPPFLDVAEAYDAGIRKGLMDFIGKMGWQHERVAKLGVNEWGQYVQGGEIKSKFGGPDFVIMHEIGHGLEERYGISQRFLSLPAGNGLPDGAGQLAALADLRAKGFSASRKFRKYIQTIDEQVANAVHAYLYAPDEMARVAPGIQKVMYNITREHPELEDLNDIKPGVAIKSDKMKLALAGPVLAGRWTLPDGAASVLTNFLSPGLGRFMAFRGLRTASNILNGAQLGLSAFHVGFTSLDAVVSSVATGLGYALRGELGKAGRSFAFAPFAPVANYYVGKAVQLKMVDPTATHVPVLDFPRIGIKGYQHELSPTADALTRNIAELAVKGGLRAETDPFWKTAVTRNLMRAVHEGGVVNYAKAGLRVPFAIVEQLMRPIAEYLVPRQKLGVFAQLALQEMHRMGWNASVEDVRAGMARAADATEDRMGQMTYDNLFYNKAIKDVALLGFRAYGWQLGKYRHLYGGVSDTAKLVTHGGEKLLAAATGKASTTPKLEITNRMLYPVALTMVGAIAGAIVHRLCTGQNPQSLQDYMFPQSGQVGNDGRPQRLMLPTYLKDLESDWKDFPDYRKMGASFYHKLNPWIAESVDMWRNQDYYGVEIRHPDDPLGVQMRDLSLFAAKQFTPFSISGTMKLAEEKAPASQLALPFFGIVPAKKALTMTPAETLAADIMIRDNPRTREQADHSQLLKTIVRDLRNVPGAKVDPAFAAAQLRPGDEKALISMGTLKPLQYQVHKMGAEDAVRVWRLANAAERQLLQQQIALKLANSETLGPAKRTALLKEVSNPAK